MIIKAEDLVKIKLTSYGKDVLIEKTRMMLAGNEENVRAFMKNPYTLFEGTDEEGYTEWTLWEVMHYWGDVCYIQNPEGLPFTEMKSC